MTFPTRTKAYLLLFSILALSTSASARKNTTNGLQSTLSFNTVVGFQVTLPDGTTSRLAATEGQMARIGNNAEGWQFGVIPFVTDAARSVVQFDVFRITNDKAGNPSVHFLSDLQVSKDSPAETQTYPKLHIEVLQLASVAPVSPDAEAAPGLADNTMGPAGGPTSGRMIKVEFTLPGGGTAQVGMAEGQMA